MNTVFRLARVDDLPALAALVNRAYRGDSARLGWTHEADLLDGTRVDESLLAEQLMLPSISLVIARQEGVMVGAYQFEDKGDGSAYLGMVTVEPSVQKSGLGKELLADAIARAKHIKANSLLLTVIEGRDELVDYYQRRGFLLTNDRTPFDTTDSRYGIPKRKLTMLKMLLNLG